MVLEIISIDVRLQRKLEIFTKRQKLVFSTVVLKQDDLCALYCSCHAAITLIGELTNFSEAHAHLEIALHGAYAVQVVIQCDGVLVQNYMWVQDMRPVRKVMPGEPLIECLACAEKPLLLVALVCLETTLQGSRPIAFEHPDSE